VTDLRQRVEEDRGLIKKIELAIPGFRGYRKREDLRVADSLLRKQLADRLGKVAEQVEESRQALAKAMELGMMNEVGELVSRARAAEARVRHAEQGYTGVSGDYRIEEYELNRLYEWDLCLIRGADGLKSNAMGLQAAIRGEKAEVQNRMAELSTGLKEFELVFDKRREAIAGLEVAP